MQGANGNKQSLELALICEAERIPPALRNGLNLGHELVVALPRSQ
jgi:hypothetical protein